MGLDPFNTKPVNHVYSQGVASIQTSYLQSISGVDMPVSKERGMQRPSGGPRKPATHPAIAATKSSLSERADRS
jgi:hypothetical protein